MSPTKPLSSLLRCARCSYEWIPRKDELPKRCPKCRSIKWNDSHLRVTCLRCGHTWNSHNGSPKRCPSCGTHQWNTPPRSYTCKRCGYSWNAKGTKVPRKCPLCSSKDWASEREADFQRAPSRESEVDAVLEGLILGEYRKGRSCVDISISEGIPYSLVFETVKRNSTTANNIKV